MSNEDKSYEDLKTLPNPPDFSDDDDKQGDSASDEEEKELDKDKEEEEKDDSDEQDKDNTGEDDDKKDVESPAWVEELSTSIKSVSERLDKIEAGAKAPTDPPIKTTRTDEFKPDYEKGVFFPKDYKPKSYNEHAKKVLDIVEGSKKHKEQIKSKQEAAWNQEWDRQLDQLTAEGKLPKVVNPNDPKDPGKKARTKLIMDAATAGSTDILSFHKVLSGYKPKKKKIPPSSRAPVGKGVSSSKPAKGTKQYKDLKKDLDAIKAEKYPELVT